MVTFRNRDPGRRSVGLVVLGFVSCRDFNFGFHTPLFKYTFWSFGWCVLCEVSIRKWNRIGRLDKVELWVIRNSFLTILFDTQWKTKTAWKELNFLCPLDRQTVVFNMVV